MCDFHSIIVTAAGKIFHLPCNSHVKIRKYFGLSDDNSWECEGATDDVRPQKRWDQQKEPTGAAIRACAKHYESLCAALSGSGDIAEIFFTWRYSDVRKRLNLVCDPSQNGPIDYAGFDLDGMNAAGFDIKGYDSDGYDRDGYDIDGYDRDGYDIDGYDRAGYDYDGYDRDGYDYDGYDRDGYEYDRDGNETLRLQDLWVDLFQGGLENGQAFGYIGTDSDEFCGWFFDWPTGRPVVTTDKELEAVVDSLNVDETKRRLPAIPRGLAEQKLRTLLAANLRRHRMSI